MVQATSQLVSLIKASGLTADARTPSASMLPCQILGFSKGGVVLNQVPLHSAMAHEHVRSTAQHHADHAVCLSEEDIA